MLILVVSFMVVLDFSIVNVALASIERELHVGATSVQWVITAYAIAFGGLLVLGGRIGDLFGRRRMFIVGLVLFSAASLGGGFAGNIGVLVAARALQGIGAALLAPAALSLITTTIPEGPARTRALGFYGATASVGFVAGLVLGGIMAVAPLGVPAADAFAGLTPASAAVRAVWPSATIISAGMSGDLEEAVAAGATHLRIGTALLGDRRPPFM